MTLKKVIIEHIKKHGPISFEKFMDMALYYPDMGYYCRQETTIGQYGDFYTSPHLSSVFGAALVRQIQEMWEIVDKPEKFTIVEPGPGIGYLCLDIISYLEKTQNPLLKCLQYNLLEYNPSLKLKQQELLQHHTNCVSWFDRLEAFDFGCILAHEVIDAFPVRRVVNTKAGLKEVYVTVEKEQLSETLKSASPELIDYFTARQITFPHDYRTEINLKMKDWICKISHIIAVEGFVLIIDYGYTQGEYFIPERNQGTILCYHNHRVSENFYDRPGEQDITAHVNFTDLHLWSKQRELETVGFCPQISFLLGIGIDELIIDLYHNSHNFDTEIRKIKGVLIGTGQSHHVMSLYKGKKNPLLRGFTIRNRLSAL